jgi:drug/metabolite transporter (DMT)-like permease
VGRDEELLKIVELGRQTRKPTPRWLWIVAGIVGVVCATGFAIAMLGDRLSSRPASPTSRSTTPGAPAGRGEIERRPAGSGLGAGLAIGAAAGIVIGFSIARQRRSHSSRNTP